MGESYAGITVPEGEPDTVRAAASQLHGVAGRLDACSAQLSGLPASVGTWQGPASVRFAGACHAQAAAARSAAQAVPDAATALDHFARELEQAQRDARQAIDDARDAQHRIDRAESDIAVAQADQTAASARVDAANHRIAVSSLGGTPDVAAQADLRAASDAAQAAADRETRARRRIEEAKDDLQRAKRRGQRAMERARDAQRAISGALGGGPAMPPLGAPGAPATSVPGIGAAARSSAVWDALLKSVDPTAKRTEYQRFRFWEGWTAGVASTTTGMFMKYASENWMRMVPTMNISGKVLGPDGAITVRQIFTIPYHSEPDEMTRSMWAARGKLLKRGGLTLSAVSGFADQWARDSADPNLATDERIGRATAEGTTMLGTALGSAAAGAAIGSVVPVGGTIVGGVAGLAIGVTSAVIVDHYDEFVVDFGGKIGDKAGDLVDGVGDEAKKLEGKVSGALHSIGL